jgi:pyridine nucleotide-disulfide oxidoreductase
MRRWLSQMPEGMFLKSESCASSLYDPAGKFTFARYCSDKGVPYPEYGTPVSREVFAQYAISFQQKLVPNVENVTVTTVSKLGDGFEVRLSSGETLHPRKVIVATGMDYTANIPEQLARLPAELRSHSADHYDFSGFKRKDVTVIGGGQSALETAALLREHGASVSLLVRRPLLVWNPTPSLVRRSQYQRLLFPRTRFGDGLGLWVYDNAPGLFHYLPQRIRLNRVKTALGPAGAWWLKDRVIGQLRILLGHHIFVAEARSGRVALRATDKNKRLTELITGHVIAATGYRFNIHSLPFLSQSLKFQLRHEQYSPLLSSNFESSVPGLYFTGLGSANSFGPAMRFLAGADYTARRISYHLARNQRSRAPSFAQSEKCPDFVKLKNAQTS